MPGAAPLIGLTLLAASALADVQVAQLTIRQRVIVRVRTVAPVTPLRPTTWKEQRGPRCVPMAALAGWAVAAPASMDIVLRTGQRVRARFRTSCPALDYYSGSYVAPSADGMICAGRDSVRDRAGGECEIARFRLLTPLPGR